MPGMIIIRIDLIQKLKRRMRIMVKDSRFYVNAIIDILSNRLIEGVPTIIDGFGIIYRKSYKPRAQHDISEMMFRKSIVYKGCFAPHKDFLKLIKQQDVELLKKKILRKSRITISSRKYRKRLI